MTTCMTISGLSRSTSARKRRFGSALCESRKRIVASPSGCVTLPTRKLPPRRSTSSTTARASLILIAVTPVLRGDRGGLARFDFADELRQGVTLARLQLEAPPRQLADEMPQALRIRSAG